jgi:quercetin dioxygenase-like cupin family protein
MAATAQKEASRHVWSELPQDFPMPRIARRRIIGERMMVSEVHLEQGFDLASHAHDNEQWVVMLSGRCLFGIGQPGTPGHREVEVRGGEVLVLPGNVPHSCRALEASRILDLFSPISERTGVDRP